MLRRVLCSSLVVLVACSSSVTSPVPGTVESDSHVDRARDFTSHRDGVDMDVVIDSGREEWRLSVTCRDGDGHGCRPWAAATLELRFDRLTPPEDVRSSLRHALHEYETSPPSTVSGAQSSCFEDNFEEPKKACTLVAHGGWSCDELARRHGHPNPDEGADEGRPRIFVVRVENGGPPIRAHVRFRAIWDGF